MNKPPLELLPPPEPEEPPRTASGLDESQIAAEDLKALHDLVKLKHLDLSASANVLTLALDQPELKSQLKLGRVDCLLSLPRVLSLRIVPLPAKPVARSLKIPQFRALLKRGLKPLYSVPVRRRRMLAGELSRELERAMYQRLFDKYGEAARELNVLAMYAHVPVEAAPSLKVGQDLREAEFSLPDKPRPDQLKGGAYLLILQDAQGKLRKLIMRLESNA